MISKFCFLYEAFVTEVTLVWQFPCVDSSVNHQARFVFVGFVTIFTNKWSFFNVCSLLISESCLLKKGISTDQVLMIALMVNFPVLYQAGPEHKILLTYSALIGCFFTVFSLMLYEVCLLSELHAALGALEGFLICVYMLVVLKV